jgi:hypothetical protein
LKLNYNDVNTAAFGVASCLIFRPENLAVANGKRYWVDIEGLRYLDGKPAAVRFLVIFADFE